MIAVRQKLSLQLSALASVLHLAVHRRRIRQLAVPICKLLTHIGELVL